MMAQYDYDRRKRAGEGDDEKSVAEALAFIKMLEEHAERAKHELTMKKQPGSAMSGFVGFMKGYPHEGWYSHWYR